MPCRDGFSSRNARKLKAKRTEERLANEDKLIDKSNERSIQYIDRIFDVKFTAKLARRNEKSKQKSKSKRKSQNKSAPFAQPGVGHAPIESDTKIESTAMTVAYRDSEKTNEWRSVRRAQTRMRFPKSRFRGHQRELRSGIGSRKVAPRVPSARGA